MNPVVHFEMPAEDKVRVAKFYEEAFGWKMEAMGADYGNYVVATTTETDSKTSRPTTPGAINGGFYGKGDQPTSGTTIVIAVDDLTASMDLVKKAGGEILGEPMDIPGVGKYVAIKDSEGNRVGMLQPAPMS